MAHSATDALRANRAAVSWVSRDNLHCTMRFLGEVDDSIVGRARDALRQAAAGHACFGAALGGFGAFPTARRARVLWMGMLQGAEPMRLLAASIETALLERGFEPADQEFEPHLTVGRVRTSGDWTTALIEAPTVEIRFQVRRLQLVQSTLGPGGSRYERLAELELGASS